MATSYLNDSGYAYAAMRDLLAAAREYYIDTADAMAEVERILTLDEEEVKSMATEGVSQNRNDAVQQ